MAAYEIRTDCPSCGEVAIPAAHHRCALADDEPLRLCEFLCPNCDREVFTPLSPPAASTLLLLGAAPVTGGVPFELLERHDGPLLSWNDLLDLHTSLESTRCPQQELTQGDVVTYDRMRRQAPQYPT